MPLRAAAVKPGHDAIGVSPKRISISADGFALRQHSGHSLNSPLAYSFGEKHDRLAIQQGLVPSTQNLEIGRPFTEGHVRLPTVCLEEIGRGGEHVLHAVPQIY